MGFGVAKHKPFLISGAFSVQEGQILAFLCRLPRVECSDSVRSFPNPDDG